MEEIKQETVRTETAGNSHPLGCRCGFHGGMYGRFGYGHWLLRLLIGLVILIVVFAIGFHLGRFSGGFGHGRMMGGRGFYGGMGENFQRFPPGMMGQIPYNGMMPQASTTPQ